jgi:hypothetical protein
VHHFSIAFRQTAVLSGSTLGWYLQLLDGTTGQCAVVFRQDGAILLTSGGPGGTVLDTYTGAVTAQNTWFQFEFEIVINNTTGSWAVRKNGNTVNDRALGGLNTRPGTNAYANKLQMGVQGTFSGLMIDDLLWRSDATTLAWLGDIRCFTRLPASDASAQFARSPTTNTQSMGGGSTVGVLNGTARYTAFVPVYSGTTGTVTVTIASAATCNMKCSIFASSGGVPTTVLGSATPVALSAANLATFIFGTPVAVVKGTQYWIGVDADANSGAYSCTVGNAGFSSVTAYASFPAASPSPLAAQAPACSAIITTTVNSEMVSETLQDGTTTYVYDATPGHADLYNLAALSPAPVTVHAVTTRGFDATSDAGTRTGAMQLRSFAPGVTTWNPADKNAAIALSGGNLTATSSAGSGSANCAVRATQAISTTQKQYFEVTVSGTVGQYLSVGVMNAAASLSANIAQTNGAALVNNLFTGSTRTYINGTQNITTAYSIFSSGQVIRVAVDRAANKIWWAVNNNPWTSGATPWIGSTSGTTDDPATGTGGANISGVTGAIYPALGSAWTGDVATFNGGTAAFAYTPPTGFTGVDITSGTPTTVASPTLALSSSFLWAWRTDSTNPATSTAWTPAAVDAVQLGPLVVA